MADPTQTTPEQANAPTPPATGTAVQAKGITSSTESSAAPSTDNLNSAASAETSAQDASKNNDPDPEILALLEKVKNNIHNTLDEEQLSKALNRRIKKIKNWNELSESAKITCVHILTTQILYKNTDVEIQVDELSVAESEERDVFYEYVNSLNGRPYFHRKAFREEFSTQKIKNKEQDSS